jgi:hypothetical protein
MLTKEEIQAKADGLTEKYKVKVHPMLFQAEEGGEQIIGFIREPARIVKMRVLDKTISSPMTASAELLEACLIVEESDPRILSEASENDKIYIGACISASNIIKFSQDQFKKK